ncbi:hypothetical protein GCM10009549_17930 [Streptomyces thermoalcalitolerans]|uniref:Uncharacterized protein n=1 Tax=Streptomyces thermoalcalitolerans TaxID=65605 RepID=A0ABN1NJ47_9ACTN
MPDSARMRPTSINGCIRARHGKEADGTQGEAVGSTQGPEAQHQQVGVLRRLAEHFDGTAGHTLDDHFNTGMAQPQAFGGLTEQLLDPIPVGLRTGERYLRQKLPDMEVSAVPRTARPRARPSGSGPALGSRTSRRGPPVTVRGMVSTSCRRCGQAPVTRVSPALPQSSDRPGQVGPNGPKVVRTS